MESHPHTSGSRRWRRILGASYHLMVVVGWRETLIIKHQDVLISFNLSTCSTTIQPPSPTPALLLLPFSDDSGDNRERIRHKWTNIWNVFTHRKSHTFYQGFTSTVLPVALVLFAIFLPELSDDPE